MQRNTGYFPTESLEPSGNRLFSRSALNEGYLFRGSLNPHFDTIQMQSLLWFDIYACKKKAVLRPGIQSNINEEDLT